MAKNTTQLKEPIPEKALTQKLYEIAEAVPVHLGKSVNAVLKKLMGGSRSERLIVELMPIVEEIGEIGERLEEDLREDMGKRSIDELLKHFPDTLELTLTDELLRDSPEEVRERRCGEIAKKITKDLGEAISVALVPGLTLDVQSQWHLLIGDDLRTRLCQGMRERLAAELVIAPEPEMKQSIAATAREKFAAEIADDMARAIVSRIEKGLRMPVSELFFRPLTASYKARLAQGEPLDDLLPEAFATGRLASQLVVKTPGDNPKPMRHFDVQLIGSIVLHQGKIAEMVTGEGKTLVATLPAYLNALEGKGVHVVTTNNFLARRDAAWMGPLYDFLGLTVGYLRPDAEIAEKQKAYQADITYGTNGEFGFDYLRDNMKPAARLQVQRPLHYAIVDEVDNILIDEARTPLIISGMPEESTDKYYKANAAGQRLKPFTDYEVKEKEHTVTLGEQGIVHAQELLGVDSFYTGENVDWPHHMNQALVAKELYRRDRDYVVKNGEVIIVDEFTGRLMPGRRWSDGLHQAVEAKERLRIKQETQTLATITYQNFFRMYEKLAGMTGTALTEAEEFDKIYGLDVVPIPTNRPLRRLSFPDVIFATKTEKYEAIIDEIIRVHEAGRPVLVGTIAIEVSEHLSRMLEKRGIKHEVLNAKYHEREAYIIARAGQAAAVTIATNMAGRGTDIVLGDGVVNCRRCIVRRDEDPDPKDNPANICKGLNVDPNKTVTGIDNIPCGLHIVGTERHEARRIDNQLRGRAGRQGDPGSSRFFLSLEDDLMRIFMGEWVRGFMTRAGFGEGQQIESPMVSRAIGRAQQKVEQYNFEVRKHVLEYDEVMDEQRRVIYGMRRKVLEAMEPVEIHRAIENLVARFISDDLYSGPELKLITRRTFEPLEKKLETFGVHLSQEEWLAADEEEFARLIKQRLDPGKVDVGEDRVRARVESGFEAWLPAGAHPSTWNFAAVAEWAGRHGIKLDEAQLGEEIERAADELVLNRAAAAAAGKSFQEYLSDWVAAALIIDLPLIASADSWDYSHVRQWADRLGLTIPVAEWDPISRKRDKQEELILTKMLKACEGLQPEEAARRYAEPVLDIYVRSSLFRADPKPERIALWAQRRLKAKIDTGEIRELVAVLKRKVAGRALQPGKGRGEPDRYAAAAEVALAEVERYLADDFASEDRNLAGIAKTFEERYRVRLPVFEMSKMSRDDLVAFLIGRVPPEVKYEIDAETVEQMAVEMVEKSIVRAAEQFIDQRAAPDILYASVRDWLEPHGYEIAPEEWENLTLPELGQVLGTQARRLHGDGTKEEVIGEFVPLAIETFLNSPLFAGEGGYSALAAWAEGQFSFGVSGTIDADIRKIGDKRKAVLRDMLVKEKVDAYSAVTDDAGLAAREMVGEAVDRYLDVSAASEDFDEMRVANWASKAFGITLSRNELESRLEEGESAIRQYIVETGEKSYARRKVAKVAEDVVDAVLDLCTSNDFVENWDYDLLEQWIRHSSVPMGFDISKFQEDTRSALVGHFVDLAAEGYKDRAKEEVIPRVIANAVSVFVDCELSSEGRNYRALSTRMNQKFGLGVSPFRLSKIGRAEVEEWLCRAVGALFEQRKRELGKNNFLRSASALMLHTLDTRWKDHLYAMDHLKSGIGLRGYAGVDPKDAYKKEGYEMFTKMLSSAEESISDLALRVHFDAEESKRMARRRTAEERYVHEEAAAFDKGREQAAAAGKEEARPKPIHSRKAPGRNDPCPCGRKKSDGTPVKYKNCCMKKGA